MKMHQFRRIRMAILALVLVIVAGCGGSESSVSGSITLDGQPLATTDAVRVTIMFFPESGGAPAAARADESGQYSLSTGGQSGLAPGDYTVAISANDAGRPQNGEAAPAARATSPLHYANPKLSGLKAEVEPGSNTFDFDLKSSS